jgi:alpha-ketoglutarate-dependent taurine dioxygenase
MPETLTATTHVGITRLAGQIGAEITGADTGTPLSDEVVARIRQALLDHKVVFLRGQSLNYRRQVQLRMAHQMLAAMGAEAFAERARRELVATGDTVRKRTVETHVELTAQERQIARRARDG